MKANRRRGASQAAWSLALALGSVAPLGCNPSASGGGTVPPGGNGNVPDGAEPEGRDEGDNIGDLAARLDRLTVEQAQKASTSNASFEVCEDLCSLASSICTVKEKLCEVADRHPGEEEYQGLCRKAELECGEAEDSCVACVEARQSKSATAGASEPEPAGSPESKPESK
ncbi:hypothetical protein [Paraliomyxa miuraensis]|uniref:hypothetical protein n=1 Tax=Paraliomyxa miuraensis TaxID=376150 RepID=UPI00225AFAE5|nr:hypothetical protein [Paraliomyxa miuraensis]MCX4245047.1 hypothetical protein [Paraliomyxa miuraensis]